jgi:YD repeat-containing protein
MFSWRKYTAECYQPNSYCRGATIDGAQLSVLQWPAPEAGSRVTVTASPPMLNYGSTPTVFSQGDSHNTQLTQGAGQCVVLQFLQPGASHTLSIVIEHPGGPGFDAYQTRTDITVTAPAAGFGDPVRQDTTGNTPYVPQTRVFLGAGNSTATDRPEVTRTVDRWGNVTQIDNPRGLAYNTPLHTAYAYNANNQLIRQTQQLDEDADGVPPGQSLRTATTDIYYDALGRQVGVRDANGNVNVKTFDAAGNLVQERHADGGQTDTTYDAFGDKLTSQVKMTVDGSRIVGTDYTYDKMSRLTKTALHQGITAYTVSTGGDRFVSPGQGIPTDFANGAVVTASVQTTLQTNTYDEAGRKTAVINGANEITRYAYDLAGNVILSGQVDPSLFFDPLNPNGNLRYTTRSSFDALNHKTGQTDGNGNTQTWTYTQQGRLVGHKDFALNLPVSGGGAGASQTSSVNSHPIHYTYTYDTAGQLTHVRNDAALAQNIDYAYDTAGQLTQINDQSLGQTTQYTYDLSGNRVREQLWQKTLLAGTDAQTDVLYQDNHLAYDALNRLRVAGNNEANVSIHYDRVGNRSRIETNVFTLDGDAMDGQSTHLQRQSFTYDSMNRQSYVQTSFDSGADSLLATYTYDLVGNRVGEVAAGHGDTFTFDDLNRVVAVQRDAVANFETRQYDGAGRMVASQSFLDTTVAYERRYNVYDALGKLQTTLVAVRDTRPESNLVQLDDINYAPNVNTPAGQAGAGYDEAGNLLGYTDNTLVNPYQQGSNNSNITTRTHTTYAHLGSYLQAQVETVRTILWGPTDTATSTTWYDANGFVSNTTQVQNGDINAPSAFNRAFVNDAQGHAVYVNQGAESGGNSSNSNISLPAANGRIQNLAGGYLGGWIGNRTTNPGHVQHQMVVAGEVLARYGDAADKSAPAGTDPAFDAVAELYLSAPGSALHGGNADPVSHTVVQGETLQSIARSTLGDSRLWYRIAQANGLSVQPDAPLQAGVTLSIPKATLSANSASTFRPYDPSRVIGDTNPALNALPIPQADDGCGGFGQILTLIVVVVVIAITQQYELAGEGLAIVGEAEAAQAGYTTAQLAEIGASSSGASFSAGAIAGAAGSVAGQLVGYALGIQDGFSWQAVALGALSGGIGGALSGVDFTGGAINGLGNTIVRSAVGSALTQGIAVATGLQRSFSWTNVAASAIGAGVGYGANEALGLTSNGIATNAFSGADRFGRAALGSLAASTATALAHGGRVSITQIGVNAFGQSIGSSLAEQAMMGGTQEDRLGGFMAQQDAASMQRDMSAAQSSFRQQEITAQKQAQALSDAVYGWSNGSDGLGFKGNGGAALRYGSMRASGNSDNGLYLSNATEERLKTGQTITDYGDPYLVSNGPTADPVNALRRLATALPNVKSGYFTDNFVNKGLNVDVPILQRQFYGATLPLVLGEQMGIGLINAPGRFVSALDNLFGVVIEPTTEGKIVSGLTALQDLGKVSEGLIPFVPLSRLTAPIRFGRNAAAEMELVMPGRMAANPMEHEAVVMDYLQNTPGYGTVGGQVHLKVTLQDGTSFKIIPDALEKLESGAYRIHDAKFGWDGKDMMNTEIALSKGVSEFLCVRPVWMLSEV